MKIIRKVITGMLLVIAVIVIFFVWIILGQVFSVRKHIKDSGIPPQLTSTEMSVIAEAVQLKMPQSTKAFKAYYNDGWLFCYIFFESSELKHFISINSINTSQPIDSDTLFRSISKPWRRTGYFGMPKPLEWWNPSRERILYSLTKPILNDTGGFLDILVQKADNNTIHIYAVMASMPDTYCDELKSIFPVWKFHWDIREWNE